MKPSEREAFRAYVTARAPALLGTAYLLTGHPADAEDLLQDALARLARNWHRVQERESTDAYVRRIMVNLRTSNWRRRRIDTYAVAELPETGRHVTDVSNVHADRDEMWLALATLPPRMRAVLVLRYYEDLSEAEIAATLGCSVGTVKSQSSRALAKLRAIQSAPQGAPTRSAPTQSAPTQITADQEATSC